jgi:hypothetical protein
MPNANYRAGRTLEYKMIEMLRAEGFEAFRTAGSHGPYDVVGIRVDRKPQFIQCKRTSDKATAERLLKSFKSDTIPSPFYHQIMAVKVKGSTAIRTVTI